MKIKEYWNLIGQEPFPAITWEPDFSQACIPDKTNDIIFLKSKKTLFLGHFCPMGIFSKKSGSVTHNFIWAPNTMLIFRKN